MYWDSKEQIDFIRRLDKGAKAPELKDIFNRSITAIQTKIATIKRRRKEMAERGITRETLTQAVIETNGCICDISIRINVPYQMVLAFMHTHPDVFELLHRVQAKHQKIVKAQKEAALEYGVRKPLAKPLPKKPVIQRLTEQATYREKNPFREALCALGNRVKDHPKYGRTLDGRPTSVKQIIIAAGTGDYRINN